MTAFKELAERIEADPYGFWYCCDEFFYKSEKRFFQNFFMPTEKESEEYQSKLVTSLFDGGAWLSSKIQTREQDNYDRITALLFADELWNDEENHKYERS